MRILLVDDVQLDRMQLAIRLKQLGHMVEAVSSGQEALDIYSDFDPELVLLDISMPGMNGFELSQKLRQRYTEWIPFIFLSGHEEPSMIAKAIDAGGDDYLIKPVDKLVLNSKLIAMQRIAFMRRELKKTTAELAKVNEVLKQQVDEDGLTNLYNRRFIDSTLSEAITWHGRHNLPLSLIMLDVDNFKAYNDNYGHIEGDKCLISIGQMAKDLFCRSGEYVGRYGGEEFVILLTNTDSDSASSHAQRIHHGLESLAIAHNYNCNVGHVTVSQGVLTIIPTGKETIDELYTRTDEALYRAKSSGRNCFKLVT